MEFPQVIQITKGYRVQIGKGSHLPGMYTSRLAADRAVKLHLGRKADGKKARRKS